MLLIVTSTKDMASKNMLKHLLMLRKWSVLEKNVFGNPIYKYGRFILVTTNAEHIFFDRADEAVKQLGFEIETVIYASKHKSASGMRTLTVHPIGNVGTAEFGGLNNKLIETAPHLMTAALRSLKRNAAKLEFAVSFEATHHGPYLESPAFFVEIGSDETAWEMEEAGRACATAILELELVKNDFPAAIGIGGGHYMPRITDVALERKIAFGHLIPSYAVSKINDDIFKQVVEKTPFAKYVYFHRKALSASDLSKLGKKFEKAGISTVREADLEILEVV